MKNLNKMDMIQICKDNRKSNIYFLKDGNSLIIKIDNKKIDSSDFLNKNGYSYKENLIIAISPDSILKYGQCNDISIDTIIDRVNKLVV